MGNLGQSRAISGNLGQPRETEHFLLQAMGGIQATSDVLVIGDESLPHAWESFAPAEKYTMVIDAITRFIDVVTTGHEQAGDVGRDGEIGPRATSRREMWGEMGR